MKIQLGGLIKQAIKDAHTAKPFCITTIYFSLRETFIYQGFILWKITALNSFSFHQM